MANPNPSIFVLFILLGQAFCWSQDELDIFDLVEEVGENFYDLLQVQRDCSSADIRKAYRRLSLQYHPDKNPDPNAAEIFTKIGAVADVLRDEEKREMYDDVLENGLPDWKQPIYYYRRVRKMSMLELVALLLTVLTIGQFLYGWAAYFEKQIVLYELRSKRDEKVKKSKGKKTHQQLEAEVMYYELLAQSYVPRIKRLLPFLIIGKVYGLVKAVIVGVYGFILSFANRTEKERKKREQLEQEKKEREDRERERKREEERQKELEERARIKSERKLKKLEQSLKATKLQNEEREMAESKRVAVDQETKADMEERLKEIEQEYEESEESSLRVGKVGGRKKIKKGRRIIDLSDTVITEPTVTEATPPLPPAVDLPEQNGETHATLAGSDSSSSNSNGGMGMGEPNNWSQYQQNQLQWALSHYTKDVEGRWDKIAKAVPGKSKAECLGRYRELVKLVQQSKHKGE